MKFSVLGGGKWGTTLAILYAHKFPAGNPLDSINLWVRPQSMHGNQTLGECIANERRNPKLGDILIPKHVQVSTRLEEVLEGSDIVLCAIPSEYLPNYLDSITQARYDTFVNCSKGVVGDFPICRAFQEKVNSQKYATLSGPNIADQVAQNFADPPKISPAFSTIAFDPTRVTDNIKGLLEFKPYLRLYPHDDVYGVEYCGILKNIYALALGMCLGLEMAPNTVTGVFHGCGREIKRILEYLGITSRVYDETYAGYPDLEVTYRYGRHGRLGQLVARQDQHQIDSFKASECIEGIRSLKVMWEMTHGSGVHLPILNQLHAVFYDGLPAKEAMMRLLKV